MKRIISLVVLLLLVFSFCGCKSKTENNSSNANERFVSDPAKTIEGFLEKYKRTDIEDFKKDPSVFLKDMKLMDFSCDKSKALEYFRDWDEKDSIELYDDATYEKEVILYNTVMELDYYVYVDKDNPDRVSCSMGSISFESTDNDAIFDIAESVCKFFFKQGDATDIEIEYEEVPEIELQKMFNNHEFKSFNASFDGGSVWFNIYSWSEEASVRINSY